MTPTALAERYIRRAQRDLSDNPLAPRSVDMSTEVMALALHFACSDLLASSPGGFDRSATLAKAAAHKAEETAQGPKHL